MCSVERFTALSSCQRRKPIQRARTLACNPRSPPVPRAALTRIGAVGHRGERRMQSRDPRFSNTAKLAKPQSASRDHILPAVAESAREMAAGVHAD
jgi:hypothetical protein